MEEIKLDVFTREELGSRKIKSVRRGDFVPAVVYGGQKKNTVAKVDRRTYERIKRQHAGESVIFRLNVMEGGEKLRDYSAIVKEEQHDPVSERILHIDFHRISLKEKLEVKVPVRSAGEPIGVKRDGGSLDHVLWELDVICLPTNIPQHIDVDVSELEIGNVIHLKDIVLPEGVETKHDLESILFHVVPPMKEEEAAPEEGEGDEDAEPEVIKEKKADEKTEEGTKEQSKEGE